jgi:hypothetical protein
LIDRWIANGTPTPTANRIEIASLDPFEFAVDAQTLVPARLLDNEIAA